MKENVPGVRKHLTLSPLLHFPPRKRTSPAKEEHMAGVKDSLLAHSSDPVEMRRLNYQTQGMDTHTHTHTKWILTHTCTYSHAWKQTLLEVLVCLVGCCNNSPSYLFSFWTLSEHSVVYYNSQY